MNVSWNFQPKCGKQCGVDAGSSFRTQGGLHSIAKLWHIFHDSGRAAETCFSRKQIRQLAMDVRRSRHGTWTVLACNEPSLEDVPLPEISPHGYKTRTQTFSCGNQELIYSRMSRSQVSPWREYISGSNEKNNLMKKLTRYQSISGMRYARFTRARNPCHFS